MSIMKLFSGLLLIGRHIVYAGHTKKFIELRTNQKQTGESSCPIKRHENDIH